MERSEKFVLVNLERRREFEKEYVKEIKNSFMLESNMMGGKPI